VLLESELPSRSSLLVLGGGRGVVGSAASPWVDEEREGREEPASPESEF